MAYQRLGDILLSAHMITGEQLNTALRQGQEEKKRLGQVLIDTGVITEQQLIDVLKMQLGVESVDLSSVNIPTALAQLVPRSLARKYTVVPVKLMGDELHLAMVDPLNFVAIEEVRNATKKRIIPMIATISGAERAIATLYGNEGVSRAIDEMQRSIGAMEAEGQPRQTQDAPSAPAIRLVNSIVERAVAENASDIHLEPRETGMVVRMRIDGVLHTMLTVPGNLQNAIISRVKILGNMNIAEKRIPQDGRSNMRLRGEDVDLRISTLPTAYGEKIVIRLLRKSSLELSCGGVGLTGDNLVKFRRLIRNSNGVVLIVGPTGSGKSSTMYTMIGEINSEEINLVTLEDPIEYSMEGVNQVQINEKVGMTFASGLRAILRQDPDVIAVGEIRDGETAEIAMRAAITGHLVISTVHTNDAVTTLDRLVDIGVEPYLISSALKGVISQRLVRKICPRCRRAYTPDREEREMLGIGSGDGVRFYRGEGCAECLNTGYRGRTAAFEILVLNDDIRRAFRETGDSSALREVAERSGFRTLREDCRRLVEEGVTTTDEVRRILNTTE